MHPKPGWCSGVMMEHLQKSMKIRFRKRSISGHLVGHFVPFRPRWMVAASSAAYTRRVSGSVQAHTCNNVYVEQSDTTHGPCFSPLTSVLQWLPEQTVRSLFEVGVRVDRASEKELESGHELFSSFLPL